MSVNVNGVTVVWDNATVDWSRISGKSPSVFNFRSYVAQGSIPNWWSTVCVGFEKTFPADRHLQWGGYFTQGNCVCNCNCNCGDNCGGSF